ncbi:MAG: HAD family phosphatase [Bdellovibrionota bacterium]
MKYKAAIFDMDGLLIDSETLGYQAWQQTSAELNFDLPDEIYFTFIGRRVLDVREIFIQQISKDLDFEDVWEYKNIIKNNFLSENGMQIMPGVENILDFFESKKIPTLVATSSLREAADKWLTQLDLKNRFVEIITGEDVENGKPAPDIYLRAAEKISIDPKDCIVFEDSEQGVRSANAAGMDVVLVPGIVPPSDEIREIAHLVCKSLNDAIDSDLFRG